MPGFPEMTHRADVIQIALAVALHRLAAVQAVVIVAFYLNHASPQIAAATGVQPPGKPKHRCFRIPAAAAKAILPTVPSRPSLQQPQGTQLAEAESTSSLEHDPVPIFRPCSIESI